MVACQHVLRVGVTSGATAASFSPKMERVVFTFAAGPQAYLLGNVSVGRHFMPRAPDDLCVPRTGNLWKLSAKKGDLMYSDGTGPHTRAACHFSMQTGWP